MRPHADGVRRIQLQPSGLIAAAIFVVVASATLLFLGGAPAVVALAAHGASVIAVWLAAVGIGLWITRPLLRATVGTIDSVLFSAATGIGAVGVISLALGAVGGLRFVSAAAIIGAGLFGVYVYFRTFGVQSFRDGEPEVELGWFDRAAVRYLTTPALACTVGIAIFAALLPPGLATWQGEGNGYDVVEYHLQVPREYYDVGQIRFLPHNVYASFPQQVEILYLLLMCLAGGSAVAGISAQLLHLSMGALAVAVLSRAAPRGARLIAAAFAASCAWMPYVGALAYVELGVLLFAAVVGVVLCRAWREGRQPTVGELVLCGANAGFAAGCKYTAIVFVAMFAGAAFLALRGSFAARLRALAVFGASTIVAFSPWMIRNVAFTGNPIFPFAYRWLGGADWSSEHAEQWDRGHRLSDDTNGVVGRVALAASELSPIVDRWDLSEELNLTFWPLFAGLVVAAGRRTIPLLIWSGLIIAGWIALTHMPGRFLMPLIVPAALAVAGIAPASTFRWRIGCAITAFAAALSLAVMSVTLQRHEIAFSVRTRLQLVDVVGISTIWREIHPLNQLPVDAYIWLIGDAAAFKIDRRLHYTVVFNRDPWIDECERLAPGACVAKLRSRGVTHVVFSWPEIDRLRNTYGFSGLVTREWVAGLASAGLRRLDESEPAAMNRSWEVYEVPRE